MNASFILSELLSLADEAKAVHLSRFFKTKPGQYGEGDTFLGITVPNTRDIVKRSPELPFEEIQQLIDSEYHEARLAGFLFLVKQFKKASPERKKEVYDFYLLNGPKANNWDLVDMSCRDIVGLYLVDKSDRQDLYRLVQSDNLWEQRIAIVSTWTLIKHLQFDDTLTLSEQLFTHKHDLIHKAVGWMLREVGKKNKQVLTDFLDIHAAKMPRTALRYAIEHFSQEERKHYMQLTIDN